MLRMTSLLRQLLRCDQGQDTIEYALLMAGMAFVGAAAWPAISSSISIAYQALDTQTQDLWEPADPAGGGS